MNRSFSCRRQAMARGVHGLRDGFTLVELLIVIIILGVLAAIVTASIGSPAEQTKETTLKDQLRIVRSQLFLYKLEHNDTPPGDTLVQVLTHRTAIDGTVLADGQPGRGPYLQSFPVNPFNGRNDVLVLTGGAAIAANDSTGWLYQTDGAGGFIFVANTNRNDRAGKPLSEY